MQLTVQQLLVGVLMAVWLLCTALRTWCGLQVLTDAAKSLWRRYSAKAKDLKQSVHTVS